MDDNNNSVATRNTQTDMMVARQAQEVQVAMLSAKRFPRDELAAMDRIKATCQRPSLASQAIYAYPRSGQKVSGPSIRLAEALAQNWGNIDTGIIELENRNGKSEMMAYAWDLETNTRVTKTFSVEHKRDTKQGSKDLTDGRDVYEATANFGARRMRACILSVIPGDVVDMAVAECRATIASADKRSPKEIIDSLVKSFKEFGVNKDHLEKYLGKQLTQAAKEELLDFRAVYKAIKDGQSKPSDYFKDLEMDSVKASADKKKAIVSAHKNSAPTAPPVAPPAQQEPDDEPETPPTNKAPTPKKSIKEMAEERGWTGGKQGSLIEESEGDKTARHTAGH